MDEPLVLPPGDEPRDWSELPWDALSVVFDKIGAVAVLFAAQAVCRSWRNLALEPSTWRVVDMRFGFFDYEPELMVDEMALAVVERSGRCLQEFYIRNGGTDAVLRKISERCPELKRLHLVCCTEMTNEGLIEASKGFGSLEELQFTHFLLSDDAFKSIGCSCPNLKRFGLNCVGVDYYYCSEYNKEAMAIAKYMPQLHELELFASRLNNDAVGVILDGCPHLEFLDLRGCFNVYIDRALKHRLKGLKIVKLPTDPTDDYDYGTYDHNFKGPECQSDYGEDFFSDHDYFDFSDPEEYEDFTRVPDFFSLSDIEEHDEAQLSDTEPINLMFSGMYWREFFYEDDDF